MSIVIQINNGNEGQIDLLSKQTVFKYSFLEIDSYI